MSVRSHSKWNRTFTWMLSAALIAQGGIAVYAGDFGSEASVEAISEEAAQQERRIQRLEQMQLILRSAKVTDRSRMTVFPAAGRIFHQSSVLSRRILLWTVFILVMLSQILLLVRS